MEDYNDTALDDFLTRFGDDNPNKGKATTFNPKSNYPGVGFSGVTPRLPVSAIPSPLEPMSLMGSKPNGGEALSIDKPIGVDVPKGEGLLSKAGGVSGVMSMASGGMELFNMAKGGGYDTSAEGGGVMNATSAISSGVMKGAQAGAALGPWGAAAVGLIGGIVGGVSQRGAAREYNENVVKSNLKKNTIEEAENSDAYAMEQGQESLGLLKGLRQKQLGILNT